MGSISGGIEDSGNRYRGMNKEPSDNELPTMETPKRNKKMSKVSDALELVMELTEKTNKQLENISNELYENRNVMDNILQERRNTNAILETIACALENKI